MLNKVDYKPFDMRTISILVSHDHDASVSQGLEIIVTSIIFAHLKSNDFHQILYFHIIYDLSIRGIPYIEQLALERKDTIVISAYYLYSTHGQSFG